MIASRPTPAAAAPAALTAFLSGIERRAALFAELQSGDPAVGDAALGAVLPRFAQEARTRPMTEWPQRFWSLLLAEPGLRHRPGGARWPAAFARLAELGSGPRAALLLCLVARLPEPAAATVLGIAEPTYQLALRRALPGDGPQLAYWQALDAAARQALRDLPPARMARLAQAREAALQGDATAAPGPGGPPSPDRRLSLGERRPRWLLPALWTGVVLCALALAATFRWADRLPGGHRSSADGRELPVSEPAARYDRALAVLSHRDFDQLADTRDAALVDDLGFYAWYAAQLAAQPAAPVALPDAAQPAPDPAESDDGTRGASDGAR